MHEMSIAESILRIAIAEGLRNQARSVKTIRIRAGELRGIVPEQLSFFFDFVARDTLAAGATLEVEKVPIKARCKTCEHVFMVQNFQFLCPQCNAKDVDTIEGLELMVNEIEIA